MAHNVEHRIEGNKLVIVVDLSGESVTNAPPSSTGKTSLVASTSGYVKIGQVDGHAISLAVTVTAK